MEAPCALHGHTRSMSSLSTVVPISLDLREWSASSPPRLAPGPLNSLLDEFSIPLPLSGPSSQYGEENDDKDNNIPVAPIENIPQDQARDVSTMDAMPIDGPWEQNDTDPRALSDIRPHGEDGPVDPAPGSREHSNQKTHLPMPLLDFLDLIEMDTLEREHSLLLQRHVLALLRQCGINNRYLPMKKYLYRRMVDCFRTDRKAAFASLYSECSKLKVDSISSPRIPSEAATEDKDRAMQLQPELASWFATMSLDSRHGVITFLQKLRNEPYYLADRLVTLSSSQLNDLVRQYRQALGPETVLNNNSAYGRFDPRNLRQRGVRASEQGANADTLLQDPLFVLLNGLFDPLAPWGSPEKTRQLDVWSSVCARVIQDGKPGSDDFCLVIVDSFAEICPWTLKPQLELFLEDLMQSGQFIVDPSANKQSSSSTPLEIQNARMAVRISQFFEKALLDLVNLIAGDKVSQGVPRAALDLVHAVLSKIDDPDRKQRAKNFFASRWFCTSFLSNIILFPERHQMLLKSHINAEIRQKVFRELALRLQKALYRALSPRNSVSDLPFLAAEADTQRLLTAFEPPENISGIAQTSRSTMSDKDRQYIVLHGKDVLAMAKSLHPEDNHQVTRARPFERPISMASSYTGSTTLTAGTNDPRTGTSSSAAPSISGTSMTSNTLSSDLFFTNFDKTHGNRTIENPFRSRPSTAAGLDSRSIDEPVHTFLPELSENLSLQKPTRSLSLGDAMLLYIHADGSIGTSLDVSDAEGEISGINRPLELSELAIPTPSHGMLLQALSEAASARRSLNHADPSFLSTESTSVAALFEKLLVTSRASQNFKSAHFWSKAISALPCLREEDKATLISKAAEGYGRSIGLNRSKAVLYHDWLLRLQKLQRQQIDMDHRLSLQCEALRDKMWFCADVQNSSSYEETLNVVRALRSMAGPAPTKQTGMAAWARHRISRSFGHERAQAQALESLSAVTERGGPNKLSDAQADLVLAWLNQDSIENFCKGEERIHRFCFEIQKCVQKLVGETLLDSPVLWSSNLYQPERDELYAANEAPSSQVQQQHMAWTTTYAFAGTPLQTRPSSRPDQTTAGLGVSLPPQTFHSNPMNRGWNHMAGAQDPGLFDPYTQSGVPPALPRDWTLPPSPVSPVLGKDVAEAARVPRTKFVARLRQTLTTLLLSDLGLTLWADGSETDAWLNDERVPSAFTNAFDEFLLPSDSLGVSESLDQGPENTASGVAFSFSESYRSLLRRFRLSFDPFTKLESLLELSELASSHAEASEVVANVEASSPLTDTTLTRGTSAFGIHGLGLPRTKLTRLEEVTANCEERRLMSIGALPTINGTYNPATLIQVSGAAGFDPAVAVVQALVRDGRYRPSTLFRDLQLIATFVPSSVLDRTSKGTAFWDIGLAAMSLKSETCKLVTNQANEILTHHLSNGNRKEPIRTDSGESANHVKPGPTMSATDLGKTTLEDAAKLYTISALEGDPTAARELGLFYLTHPELVRRVTLPLSKPSEIFRSTFALGNGDKGKDGDGILDPATFAVAFHWMEFAANAGDADARTFLRENSDLGQAR